MVSKAASTCDMCNYRMCVRGSGQKLLLLCREICCEFRQRLQGEISEIGNFHVSKWEFFGLVRNITA